MFVLLVPCQQEVHPEQQCQAACSQSMLADKLRLLPKQCLSINQHNARLMLCRRNLC